MKKQVKRYVPQIINNFLKNKTHIFIKWNKDLTSTIYNLDSEGLIIICDTILRVSGSRDIKENNFCEIQTECFHKILQNDYKLYIDYLIEEGIIISDNFYIPGEKSICYKINEEFIDRLCSIDIDNKLFNKRTIKAILSTDKLKISNKHYNNFKSELKIDFNAAVEYLYNNWLNEIPDHKGRILNKYTRTLVEHKLMQINDEQLWMNRSSSNGRINSNLTTLNGNFKQFILGYDISMDIVSSQPTLLNVLFDIVKDIKGQASLSSSTLLSYEYKILSNSLKKPEVVRVLEKLKSVKLPSENEQKQWRNLCENGDLYEYFQREFFNLTSNKLTRTEVKTIMMTVLYSTNYQSNEYKKIFSSIFPTIYKFITDIKSVKDIKRSHRILPLLLQGIESFIWVENILPKLDKMNIKYHFIHDSVIIKEKDKMRTELTIMEQFYLNNIRVKISTEDIKTGNKIK
jgi:hypothetical protein